MQKFKSVEELVNQLRPDKPVYCIRKKSILSASKFFQKKFPGKILYAVKTNPHPEVIRTLLKSGIDQFDVASIEEIKSVKKFDQTVKCSCVKIKAPDNTFMHIMMLCKTFSLKFWPNFALKQCLSFGLALSHRQYRSHKLFT